MPLQEINRESFDVLAAVFPVVVGQRVRDAAHADRKSVSKFIRLAVEARLAEREAEGRSDVAA